MTTSADVLATTRTQAEIDADVKPVALPPGIDGLDIPYPDPNDRVRVAIYDLTTGDIRQTTMCGLQDMHRQHAAWPGCDYVECGVEVTPQTHVVDLKTLTCVPRTSPTVADLARKEQELWIAARDAVAMSDEDLKTLTLKAIGGDIEAQTTARNIATAREGARTKLASLRVAASSAKTRAELQDVKWDASDVGISPVDRTAVP